MKFLVLLSFVVSAQMVCEDPKNCTLESGRSPVKMQHLNVYGKPLKICGTRPMTGFYRNGSCESDAKDGGNHSVCAEMTNEFLKFSKNKGNDLITPNRRYGFPGLKAGDRWCLCAARWLEAYEVGKAPKVRWHRSHMRAIEVIPQSIIQLSDK